MSGENQTNVARPFVHCGILCRWPRINGQPKDGYILFRYIFLGLACRGGNEVTGTKHDAGKIRLDLLPLRALAEVGAVLTFGATKYSDNNWRGGMKWGRLVGAAFRHLFSFMSGEDKDPETGINHLAHAATDILFVLEYVITKTGEDDRYLYK